MSKITPPPAAVQAEYNRVIEHAIKLGVEAAPFLRQWNEGDWDACREFDFEPNTSVCAAPVAQKAAAPEKSAPLTGVATVEDSQTMPLGGFRIHARSDRPLPTGASLHLHAQQPAPQPLTEKAAYTGVRCMCVLTGCQAGPGCPHYTEHCRKHIDHERAHGITKGDA